MKDFIVLLNKSEGITRAASLSCVKRHVNKKAGHTGTLDKFASGLLIALTGRYTKFTEKFFNLKKTYLATIEFGKETDTLDPEGEVIATSDTVVNKSDLEQVLKTNFSGTIKQTPPLYSALKVNGKRSSDRIRNGEEVNLPERDITIYSSEIVSFENNIAVIRFTVSRGTYIRSRARDIALLLNSRGYLKKLVREKIGIFDLNDSIKDSDYDIFQTEYQNQSSDEYIMCIGVFDAMHIGHQALISKTVKTAADRGCKSLVLTFDKSPKNRESIMTLEDKIACISSFNPHRIEVLKWDEKLSSTSGARFMLSLQKKYNIKGIVLGKDFSVGSKDNPVTINELNLFFNDKDIICIEDVGGNGVDRVSSSYIQSLIKEGKTKEASSLMFKQIP